MHTSGRPFADAAETPAPEEPDDPADLPGIGPATAAVIDAARFDAADVPAGRVSYLELLEAGVDPGVAEHLRRRHSLVWSFVWRPGADLRRRAAQVRGLSDAEREWVRASVRDRDAAGTSGEDEAGDACPRCGGDLVTYALGDSEATECASCGYAGVAVDHADGGTVGGSETESWDEALRRFREG